MAANGSGSPLHKVGLGVRLIGASVLAGAIVAGLGIPAVGAIGLSAKSASNDFNSIPDDLTLPTLAQSSTIYDDKGNVIATFYPQDRTSVPLNKIAPIMQDALIDIEDHRYYQHGAIDLEGTLRALVNNSSSGATQGGSTLTQQYVKNVFVNNAGDANSAGFAQATRQTTGRKIQELRYAIKLEETLSKQQILDDYLNITYFGQQAYGIEAAAELYFGVHASQLTLPQAAVLAGLEQEPSAYDPIQNMAAATTRRNQVLTAMATYGTITQAQAAQAEAQPIELHVHSPQAGCIMARAGEGFFCDYVTQQILDDPAFGATTAARQQLWNQGGLKIYTTLDPKDQSASQKAIEDNTNPTDADVAISAMVQPGTGKILAMTQSKPYGPGANHTEINYNANALQDGGEGFQTGSVFKAITAATALSNGYGLDHVIDTAPGDYPSMTTCSGVYLPPTGGMIDDTPKPYGKIDMVTAMADSVNTYFAPLEAQVGLCNVVKMARAFGLGYQDAADPASPTGLTPISQVQTLTLGVNTYTPLQMADVYATFADGGTYCDTNAITSVTNAKGQNLAVPAANCHRIISQDVATGVNTLLKSVVSDQGTGASVNLDDWSDAGKTGTTNEDAAAWFDGYTSQIVDAVAMTNPNSPNETMDPWTSHDGTVYANAYGYRTAGPIWKAAMERAMSGLPDIELSFEQAPAAPQPGGSPSPGPGGPPAGTPGNPNPGKPGGGKKHKG